MKLENVKVDDILVMTAGYGNYRRLVKVAKVTPTQVVVEKSRFRKKDGGLIGSDRWNRCFLSIPTEAEIAEIRQNARVNNLAYHIDKVRWKEIPVVDLEAIAAILGIK